MFRVSHKPLMFESGRQSNFKDIKSAQPKEIEKVVTLQ